VAARARRKGKRPAAAAEVKRLEDLKKSGELLRQAEEIRHLVTRVEAAVLAMLRLRRNNLPVGRRGLSNMLFGLIPLRRGRAKRCCQAIALCLRSCRSRWVGSGVAPYMAAAE
jgi:hypothetical protein